MAIGSGERAKERILQLFGLAALLCGAGVIGNLRTFTDTRREYAELSGEEALPYAA